MPVLLEAESCILISPSVAEPRTSVKILNAGGVKKSQLTHTPSVRVGTTRPCLLAAAKVCGAGASEVNCTVKDVTFTLDQRRRKTWLRKASLSQVHRTERGNERETERGKERETEREGERQRERGGRF